MDVSKSLQACEVENQVLQDELPKNKSQQNAQLGNNHNFRPYIHDLMERLQVHAHTSK